MKYKGDIEGWPDEVVNKMMDRQEEQGNQRNVEVFERDKYAANYEGGMDWESTLEGKDFWDRVISYENFDPFFKLYPKEQPIEPINSHPFATYELVNYDSPEGTCLLQGNFAKCKEELKPGNILRPLDKSKFLRYNEGELINMRKRAQTASMVELRKMVWQCLDALSE